MGVLQHAQTTCYLHYFASLTKQGWFQGHRFRALGPRLKCAAPCLSEERLQILGQEKTAGCFSSQCVPTQQNPSSSHQQSTRNTSRSLKNKVEPVWSYGGFEWLLFPAFPSHDIQMISWSVPGFSPHSCTIHQDISSITTGPRTAQLTLESLSKSRARKSGYAISWSRSPSTCRRLQDSSDSKKVLRNYWLQFQGEAWRIDRKWPDDPWNSTFTEDYTWNITINRSSL